MRRTVAVAVAIAAMSLGSVNVQAEEQGCAGIAANCQKVRRLIREFWPDAEEDQAIACFDAESGLYKWSHKGDGSQYKGVAQLSRDIRQAHNWSWELRRQVHIAWQVRQYDRARGRSMSDRWYAPGC